MVGVSRALDAKRNSLNAIRLALALLVIVGHSWVVAGFGLLPGFGDVELGSFAVACFFAISGYLITASRLNTRNVLSFYWRRVLRIYPAFFASLVVVAFVLAPLSSWLAGTGEYSWGDGGSYVLNDLGLMMRQFGIDGTLESVAYPNVWNGSAWTLFYEALCYLGIGLLVSVVPRRWLASVLVAALMVCTAVTVGVQFLGFEPHTSVTHVARLAAFFIAGALLYLYRQRVRLSWWGDVVAVLFVLGASAIGAFNVLAPLPIAYLMIQLGAMLPLTAIGRRNDFSYGVYIFAFPVQQVLATVFAPQSIPVAVFIALSVVGTAFFAIGSWFLIEKPALRHKDLFARVGTKKLPDVSGEAAAAPSA